MSEEQEIQRLAALAGVLSDYHDQTGALVVTPIASQRLALEGLGFRTRTKINRRDSLERLLALRRGPTPKCAACEAGPAAHLPINRQKSSLEWSLVLENGEQREGRLAAGAEILPLPDMPIGYHKIAFDDGDVTFESLIICAPKTCYKPPELEIGRGFGFTTQIYGLRSKRQFGIGDLTDVGDLAAGAARWGASFLGLSPAHALFSADPDRYSPYSPSSRLFLQTQLIDPRRASSISFSVVAHCLQGEETKASLEHMQSANLIDYDQVCRFKMALYRDVWRSLPQSDKDELAAFRLHAGEALERHATFEALWETFKQRGLRAPSEWPSAFRRSDSIEAERFRAEQADLVSFHAWLQMAAARQFSAAHDLALRSGMTIGLYRDLAVGADIEGSEVWSAPERYLKTMSVGAPPDPLGPNGQDWGLPPFDPIALEFDDLSPFRELARVNMRDAGALRIDHAFQLQRLFLTPRGAGAKNGAYVSYPLQALLGVLRLESHRAKCLVIAEDLGTTPKGFSEAIMKAGVLSYRLLFFERSKTGEFAAPCDYPKEALAAVSTHDLPTFYGWLRGLDIDLRECFGVFNRDKALEERQDRALDRERLARAFEAEHLSSFGLDLKPKPSPEPAFRFLGRTPCALVALQIEDALGDAQQANLPGPPVGHPNWRRRLPMAVAELVAEGGPLAAASAAVRQEHRGSAAAAPQLSHEPPRATYRLQFNSAFGFREAEALIPYLKELGVSHIYASPITRATPGSGHGYDVNDFNSISPDLGGLPAFLQFSDALKTAGLGLLVDFVPNHMGVSGRENRWWNSVLEFGRDSPSAEIFDIDFDAPGHGGKLLLPVLGAPLGASLDHGELSIQFDSALGEFSVAYFEQRFPLRPDLYHELFDLKLAPSSSVAALGELARRFDALSSLTGEPLTRAATKAKQDLAGLCTKEAKVVRHLASSLVDLNGATMKQRARMREILSHQHYDLAFWRSAASKLNYRRFFDISTLVGVRQEEPTVFLRVHRLLKQLSDEGRIDGVRIDHVDGLADPYDYLRRLQTLLGAGAYVIVEKILEGDERLRDWPVSGTTGYEILTLLDAIFVNRKHEDFFTSLYSEISHEQKCFADQLTTIKEFLVIDPFQAEFDRLTRNVVAAARIEWEQPVFGAKDISSALRAFCAIFPVYRTYIRGFVPTSDDLTLVEATTAKAEIRLSGQAKEALLFFKRILVGEVKSPPASQAIILFQQLAGPLMAKSLEDTLFYRYNRFIALNEVGGDPSRFGTSCDVFHQAMAVRAKQSPFALTATSTHDTKRGEDARGRLLAASNAPELWKTAWLVFRSALERAASPLNESESYFFYQSFIGALPTELIRNTGDESARRRFVDRFCGFAIKALREAKQRTSWSTPDEAFERQVQKVLAQLIDDVEFFSNMASTTLAFDRIGAQASFARTLLKCTIPGVPDFYQGAEFQDFSLVDPDNRRPVDFVARAKTLKASEATPVQWNDEFMSETKQSLIARLLHDRRQTPGLYICGDYRPIHVPNNENLIAFERRWGEERLIVAARTHFEPASSDQTGELRLRAETGQWRNLLDSSALTSNGSLDFGRLLIPWPAIALRKM